MKVIKSKSLASFLMSEGLRCLKVDKDKQNPHYLVFLFENNLELDKAMKKWMKIRSNN